MRPTEKWAAVLCVAVITTLIIIFPQSFRNTYERIYLRVTPSAQLANDFGGRHLNSRIPEAYDPALSEYFFREALRIDPKNPEAYHQLARLSFLRGDFESALSHINKAIEFGEPPIPSSYYIRGLIEGFMGKFDDSARDYALFIETQPTNWAATNDLAWVLLKAKRYEEALVAIDKVLPYWPENPWLLNSKATALFELKRTEEAAESAWLAAEAVLKVTEEDWLKAYPGNDPLIAKEGVQAFRDAVQANMHTISLALDEGR